jgi:hypothetical protein
LNRAVTYRAHSVSAWNPKRYRIYLATLVSPSKSCEIGSIEVYQTDVVVRMEEKVNA